MTIKLNEKDGYNSKTLTQKKIKDDTIRIPTVKAATLSSEEMIQCRRSPKENGAPATEVRKLCWVYQAPPKLVRNGNTVTEVQML